jgi:hypothetical protein
MRISNFSVPKRPSPRALTALEHLRYAPHFAPELLKAVTVVEGRVPFWLRPDMRGVTLGLRIYFRPGAYCVQSAQGIELLAHELVHVQQFLSGMTLWRYAWASRRGYRRNPYEVAACAWAAQIRMEVCDRFSAHPHQQLR